MGVLVILSPAQTVVQTVPVSMYVLVRDIELIAIVIISVVVTTYFHVFVIMNVHVIKFVDVILFYLALVIHSKHVTAIGYVLVKQNVIVNPLVLVTIHTVLVTRYVPQFLINVKDLGY